MSLLPLYDRSLLARSARPALECVDASGASLNFTYGELENRSNRMARLLRGRGLKGGDRVALFLPNGIEFIDLWLAAAKLGLVVVPINVLYRERELNHILRDADPALVVTSRSLSGFVPRGLQSCIGEILVAEAASQLPERVAVPARDDTPMALLYTSGTTGVPKGAVLTNGNFAANALTLVSSWEITEADRYLATLPLTHAHGLANGLHSWLFSGCHMRMHERFDRTKIAQWLDEYRPTIVLGVPAMFIRLLELPPSAAGGTGGQLRLAVSGGAPLPAEVHDRFRARYGTTILERYGMTETLGNASNPYRGERRVGSVGLPLDHVTLRICDEAGGDVPDGTVGEVWVKGPNVCAGYWRLPESIAAAWRDGWFRTGDLASRAPDGYISLHGRRGDLIISGGFKIHPGEVEQVLLEQPGVREACVVGVPDPVRGEVPVAYVVVDPATFDEAGTAARLRSQLASFKVPRALIRVETIPRTALGKVQRHLLPRLR